jgi:hypothetical protein
MNLSGWSAVGLGVPPSGGSNRVNAELQTGVHGETCGDGTVTLRDERVRSLRTRKEWLNWVTLMAHFL